MAKSKGVNLNYSTILDHFEKGLKRASLGLKKHFVVGLSFIRRQILEKSDFEKSDIEKSDFEKSSKNS